MANPSWARFTLRNDGAALLLKLSPAVYCQVFHDGEMVAILNMPQVVQRGDNLMPAYEWQYTVPADGFYRFVVGGISVGDTPLFSVLGEGGHDAGSVVTIRWGLDGLVDALT